jgi:WD40 repeat protein
MLASGSSDGTILLWDLAPVLIQASSDVNSDGVVNILDMTFIASRFGENSPDLNGDGIVNILDLVLVANYIGQ